MEETGTKKGITRRGFLTAAAAIGVGTAAAGIASGPVASALADPGSGNIAWDKETDILIVGSGYAGLAAAIDAADLGAKVVLIEKSPYGGGNSFLCGGNAEFGGTAPQQAYAVANGKSAYSANDYYNYVQANGNWRAFPELAHLISNLGNSTVAWLQGLGAIVSSGTGYSGAPGYTGGHTITATPYTNGLGSGSGWWTVMYKGAIARGVTYLLQHQAMDLIQPGGPGTVVLGAVVKRLTDGTMIKWRARRAVILTGGSKSNVAMRVEQDPRLDAEIGAGGLPYVDSTGECGVMAIKAGSVYTNVAFVCELRSKWGSHAYQVWEPPSVSHGANSIGTVFASPSMLKSMIIAGDGKRFVSENIDAEWSPDAMHCPTLASTPFQEAYSNILVRPRNVWAIVADADMSSSNKTAVANPAPYPHSSADMVAGPCATAHDLSIAIGVPEANLTQQIADYNSYVSSGTDSQFGKIMTGTTPLNPPFWATKSQVFCHDQMSGIMANTRQQPVLLTETLPWTDAASYPTIHVPKPLDSKAVVPHLYTPGEINGGYYGNARGHGKIGCVMTMGRVAGQNAAKELGFAAQPTSLSLSAGASIAAVGDTLNLKAVLSGVQGFNAGSVVSFGVELPGSSTFTALDSVAVDASGLATDPFRLASAGTYHFMARFAGDSDFAPASSAIVAVLAI